MPGVTLPAVLLHGFAGTGRAWDGVRAELGEDAVVVAPDLPGHGTRGDVRPVSFDTCVEAALAGAPDEFVLAGYSMGGRIALHVALAVPERIRALVLISTTAGIDAPADRAARVAADERLARATEDGSIEDFAARWSRLPLFAGTAAVASAAWHEDMRRNDPAGLAASLRGVGTGQMLPLWDRLAELTMPCEVLVGQRDEKFTVLGSRLVAGLPAATLTVVQGAGHGLPREAPAEVAGALTSVITA
jgi:2-succinyl-6-hydroxy-2,4-cyclohexadiene-1-carboxylate synthase